LQKEKKKRINKEIVEKEETPAPVPRSGGETNLSIKWGYIKEPNQGEKGRHVLQGKKEGRENQTKYSLRGGKKLDREHTCGKTGRDGKENQL